MKERFLTRSAVILMLIRDTKDGEEILLQKRQNTGYADGYYDLSASGHVEEGESMIKALIREAKEEIGIEIKQEDVEFVTFIHKNIDNFPYYNGYFKVTKYDGEVKIGEPEKCEEIKWFNINNLPENVIDDRKQAIINYKNNTKYSEYGWDK